MSGFVARGTLELVDVDLHRVVEQRALAKSTAALATMFRKSPVADVVMDIAVDIAVVQQARAPGPLVRFRELVGHARRQ